MIIELYSMIRHLTGSKEIRVEKNTLEEALIQLAREHPETFGASVYHPETGLKSGVVILYHGKNMNSPEGLKTTIPLKDRVAIFSSIEGG